MAAIAQHSLPHDFDALLLISIGVAGYEGLTVEVLGTAHGFGIAREVFGLHLHQRHGRGRYIVASAKGYGEGLGAGFKVHGLRTAEVKGIAHTHKRGGEHVVAKRVHAVLLGEHGSAHGRLLLRVNHSVLIGYRGGLRGQRSGVDGDGLVHVVDGDDGKLALAGYYGNLVAVDSAFTVHGLAVGVGLVANLHPHAVGGVDGVVVGFQVYFAERPAATGITSAARAVKAQRDRAIERVRTYALEPVEVFGGHVRRVVRGNLVEVVGVVVQVEVGAGRLLGSELHKARAVAVATLFLVAKPLLGTVTVNVVGAVLIVCRIEGEQTIIFGRLRGSGIHVGV